jgi:hypothetical protein
MLQLRLARAVGLALLAVTVGGLGHAVADHDHGNGKSQDNKAKGKKVQVWCLTSDTNVIGDADDFGGIAVKEGKLDGLTLAEVTDLSTDFLVKEGDCAGGSPRFQLSLDTDDDGDHDGNVFVYLGPWPNYTGCPLNVWESSGNLVEDADPRWDTSQIGGTFYDTYENAVELAGGATVLDVSLVVDSGWALAGQRQVVCVDDAEVNGIKLDDPFGAATRTKTK